MLGLGIMVARCGFARPLLTRSRRGSDMWPYIKTSHGSTQQPTLCGMRATMRSSLSFDAANSHCILLRNRTSFVSCFMLFILNRRYAMLVLAEGNTSRKLVDRSTAIFHSQSSIRLLKRSHEVSFDFLGVRLERKSFGVMFGSG